MVERVGGEGRVYIKRVVGGGQLMFAPNKGV